MGHDDDKKNREKAPQDAEPASPDEVQDDDLEGVSGGVQMTPSSLQPTLPTRPGNLTIQPTGVTIQPTGIGRKG